MDFPYRTAVSESGPALPPSGAGEPELFIAALQQHMVVTRRVMKAGQYLFRNGRPFHSLYFVRKGCLKLCDLSEDGRERVTGFRRRGDMLGIAAIGRPFYTCDAVALDDCEVWELLYLPTLGDCICIPELRERLIMAMSEEIRRERYWMLTIGTLSAEQCVAAFLLDVQSHVDPPCSVDGDQFVLPMSRADLASFLMLTHETVSRALSHLEQLGYVAVSGRKMKMLDAAKLRAFAGISPRSHDRSHACSSV